MNTKITNEVVAAYRVSFADMFDGREFTGTDEQISSALAEAETEMGTDTGEDYQVSVLTKLDRMQDEIDLADIDPAEDADDVSEGETTDTTVPPADTKDIILSAAEKATTARNQDSLNRQFASRAASDPEFINILEATAEAKETLAKGPFLVMHALVRLYGDTMVEFPVPDSDKGNNPDKYKIVKTVNGERKQKLSSFYVDFYLATPQGAANVEELDMVSRAMKSGADKTKIREDILTMSMHDLDRRKNALNTRITVGRNTIKTALRLWQTIELVKREFPKLIVTYKNDKTGLPVNSTYPMIVMDNSMPPASLSNYRLYGVQAFVQQKWAELSKTDGTLDSLIKLASKEPAEKKEEQGPIETAADAITQFARLADFLDVAKHGDKSYASIVKAIYGKTTDQHLLKSVGDVCLALDGVWNHIQRDYNKLNAKERNADKLRQEVAKTKAA